MISPPSRHATPPSLSCTVDGCRQQAEWPCCLCVFPPSPLPHPSPPFVWHSVPTPVLLCDQTQCVSPGVECWWLTVCIRGGGQTFGAVDHSMYAVGYPEAREGFSLLLWFGCALLSEGSPRGRVAIDGASCKGATIEVVPRCAQLMRDRMDRPACRRFGLRGHQRHTVPP
jgi:hypothetical protein